MLFTDLLLGTKVFLILEYLVKVHVMADAQNSSQKYAGFCDILDGHILHGWAIDHSEPSIPVTVEIFANNAYAATVVANQYREDLRTFGHGNHAFKIELPPECFERGRPALYGQIKGTLFRLTNSESLFAKTPDPCPDRVDTFKVDVYNFDAALTFLKGKNVQYLLFDPIDTCNAKCLYCPNHRTNKRLSPSQFGFLIRENIRSIGNLQIGCGQEPTAHKELGEFFKEIFHLQTRPALIQMITNGMLLHKHDLASFQAAGLHHLHVSIDSISEDLTRRLRPGTSVEMISENLARVRTECPNVELGFSIVVTRESISGVEDLIHFGLQQGVMRFAVREVVDHSCGTPRQENFEQIIRSLELAPGEFSQLQEHLKSVFPDTQLEFIDAQKNRLTRPRTA